MEVNVQKKCKAPIILPVLLHKNHLESMSGTRDAQICSNKSHELVSLFTGAKCKPVRGRAGDSGGHGRQRTLHPRQRVGPDEGAGAAELEQPNLHPISPGPGAQLRNHPAALPR